MEPYRSLPDVYCPMPLINTENIAERVMVLPTGTSVDEQVIQKICKIMKYIVSNSDEVNRLITNKQGAEIDLST
jgi:dTDP-4-amino-4,6-dideoxygalactose transaminase